MDYHPSKDVTPNPQSSKSINCHRSRRGVCSSCEVRQSFDLRTDEIKYLNKLKVASQKFNWKLCHNIKKTHNRVTSKGIGKSPHSNGRQIPSRQKWFSLFTCLFGWGGYMNVRNIRKIKQICKSCKVRMICKKVKFGTSSLP